MWINACPRCQGRALQARSEYVPLRSLPHYLEPRALISLVVALGALAGLLPIFQHIGLISPTIAGIRYLPVSLIVLAGGLGYVWWKLRLGYGKVVYHCTCRTCAHQWTIEETN